jgi:tetratricopeptide (TPR) repeat protein
MPNLAIGAEPPFIGASRQALLADVKAAYGRVAQRQEAHLVLLSGDTGEGKTRILRELYSWLAASQSSPRYWPTALQRNVPAYAQSRDIQDHLRRGRNIISPERPHLWPANAFPEWLWLPVRGEIGSSGEPTSTVSTLEREIASHLPAVWARMLSSYSGLASEARRQLTQMLKDDVSYDSLGEIVKRIVELSAGMSLPLLPSALKAMQRTAHGITIAHEIRRQLRDNTTIRDPFSETHESTQAVAAGIKNIARTGLPVLIALDNLESQHPSFYNLFDDLLPAVRDNDSAILVIGTVTGSALRSWKAPLAEMLAWLEDRHRLTIHELQPMTEELDELFKLVAPKTTKATRALVRKHHSTPLRLWGFLNSTDARDHIRDYQLDVGEDLLHQIPIPSDVPRLRPWTVLPSLTQDVLALLAVASMKGQGVGDMLICPRPVLTEVAHTVLSDASPAEIDKVIAEAPEIAYLADNTLTYADTTIADLASAEGERRFASMKNMIRTLTVTTIAKLVEDEQDSSYARAIKYLSAYASMGHYGDRQSASEIHAKRLIVSAALSDYEDVDNVVAILNEEGWPEDSTINSMAKEALFHNLIERQRTSAAFEVGLSLISDNPPDDAESLGFALAMAHLIALNGQPDLGIEALENLLRKAEESGQDTRSIKSCLGLWLVQTRRAPEAVPLLATVVESLTEEERNEGPGLSVRESYAASLAGDGKQQEARELFDELVQASRRYRGKENALTLRLEHNRLALLTGALSLEERLHGLTDLMVRRIELFGYEDGGALASWLALLNTFASADMHREVINATRAVIEQFTRAHGELNEQLISATILVGWSLAHLGQMVESEVWAMDAFRRLGQCAFPHPWQVRATTLLLVRCRIERNDWLAARDVFLPWRLQLTWRNSPSLELADTWSRLAICLKENGQVASAAQELDSLLDWPDLTSLLPAQMVVNLHNAAGSYLLEASLDNPEAYWLEKSIMHFEQAVSGASALGREDLALSANRQLVTAFRRMGRSDDAIELCGRLVEVAGREGPPELLVDLKEEMFYCYADANRVREAVSSGEELIAIMMQSASASSREEQAKILKMRHNVAVCRCLAGDVRRGREELVSVIAGREKLLGLEHEDTIISKQQLASIDAREDA